MSRGIATCIRAALAGVVVLAMLVLFAMSGPASSQPRQTVQGTILTAVLLAHQQDDDSPCEDDGTLPDPGCCAAMHGSPVAAVLPPLALGKRLHFGMSVPYSADATSRADGIPVTPALRPPRLFV